MMSPLLFHVEFLEDGQDFIAQPLVPEHRDDPKHHTELSPTEDKNQKTKIRPKSFSKNWAPMNAWFSYVFIVVVLVLAQVCSLSLWFILYLLLEFQDSQQQQGKRRSWAKGMKNKKKRNTECS